MATEGPNFTETRSFGQLTGQLIDNLTLLVHKQIDLAKQEVTETLKSGFGVAKLFGPALAVALLFVMALINLLIGLVAWAFNGLLNVPAVLALVISALIFTLLFLVITGIFAYLGYVRLMRMLENPMGNTIESISEDIEWATRQLTPDER